MECPPRAARSFGMLAGEVRAFRLSACSPREDAVEEEAASEVFLSADLPKTTFCVSSETFNDLATAKALGLAGILTRDTSTSSDFVYRKPPLSESGRARASIGLKPTLTARKMSASIKLRISSMRSDVPFGASSRCPRRDFVSGSMRRLCHLPTRKSDR